MTPALRWGSDESHFNVSVGSDGQSHRTVSTNHNLLEEKGEPKRYRTEVLPLTSLTPYRHAKPAHILECPISRVTSCGRVWRKGARKESESWSGVSLLLQRSWMLMSTPRARAARQEPVMEGSTSSATATPAARSKPWTKTLSSPTSACPFARSVYII